MVEALGGAGDGAPLTLRIPRNAVARKVVHLAKVAGGRVETVRKGATEKRPSYRLRLTLPTGRGSTDGCCARAILRGTFLARGVLGNPADAYHLEMPVLLRSALRGAGWAGQPGGRVPPGDARARGRRHTGNGRGGAGRHWSEAHHAPQPDGLLPERRRADLAAARVDGGEPRGDAVRERPHPA